jgi:hypothetical protein
MEFSGRVYFDFTSRDVWRLYRLLERAGEQGVVLDVDWRGFAVGGVGNRARMSPEVRALACYEAALIENPDRHRRFLAALLALVHKEGDDIGNESTLRIAATVAGIDPDRLLTAGTGIGFDALGAETGTATMRGVREVPSIVRHGPVLQIRTTDAVTRGDARTRLGLLQAVMEDDGIWELKKP